MHYDFSTVEDQDAYNSVPEGQYLCRIGEVRTGQARDGSERWRFRLEVVEGDYAGRTAAWDSITWSDRGVFRVKRVLAALGFDVGGEVEVDSQDLVGRRAAVLVETEEWEDAISGRRQIRMGVPYLGYSPLGEDGLVAHSNGVSGAGAEGADSSERPF
jgi:hypothetical protein